MESKDFSQKAIKLLSALGSVELFRGQRINDFLLEKNILFIRVKYYIDKDFLSKCKNLKYLCTPTTGLNHIDIQACEDRGIQIISLKGEYEFLSQIRATPEHTFGLVLSLLRNYKNAFLSESNDIWDRERYKGNELYHNIIGIIGFGRVGRILAKYFNAFDAQVLFFDTDCSIKETYNARRVKVLENMIVESNIVILSASYSEENYQFFSSYYIDLLKNKYFINTARGELIDEEYLIQKIGENHFKGVALDVLQNEQSNKNLIKFLQLTKINNLIITPHIAGATFSSMNRTEEFIVEKFKKCIL